MWAYLYNIDKKLIFCVSCSGFRGCYRVHWSGCLSDHHLLRSCMPSQVRSLLALSCFSVTHKIDLQTQVDMLDDWMTANLLSTLPKLNFYILDLNNRFLKYDLHNSTFNTTQPARNLGFIIGEHLTFSDQISAISKFCYYTTFVNFAVSVHISISKQPAPLPPPLSILNWTTVILGGTVA